MSAHEHPSHESTGRTDYDYDAIVIGGGPAGSTAAALLAREGRRVAIFDREKWPRYHIGESLLPGVLPFLEELGAMEDIEKVGFQKKTGQTFRWGQDRTPWQLDFRQLDVYPYSFFVERADFDNVLFRNAGKHGAELQEGANIEGVLMSGDRVHGVRVKGADGQVRPVTAPYVIDGSGQNAVLSRHFKTRRWVKGLRNLAVWSYWEGVTPPPAPSDEHIFTISIPDGWIWFLPMRNGRWSVGIVTLDWTRERARTTGPGGAGDLEAWYERMVQSTETIKDLLAGAHRVDQVRAQRDWSYCTTRFNGPGYCMVGDAACFIDPILSTGVQLAMTGGYLAALAVNSSLSDPQSENAYFRYFQQSYLTTYRENLTQVRYFYRTEAHRDSIFWHSKRLLRVDPQLDGALSFVFLNSGLARHVTAEHPHDTPGQAREVFSSLKAPSVEAVPYRPQAAAERRLVPPGGFVVVEGKDRRLYGVKQKGMRLILEPTASARFSDRAPGSALLFEIARTKLGDPIGTVLLSAARPDLPPGTLVRHGLAAELRTYRGMSEEAPALRHAAEQMLDIATPADVEALPALETRIHEWFGTSEPRDWSLARLPPIDSISLVEHPVAAEFHRESDGQPLWIIAQVRRHPHSHETPYARTRFVDLDYSTGNETRADENCFTLIDWALQSARESLKGTATIADALDTCQATFLASTGIPVGWKLSTIRRVVPNRWADEELGAEEETEADEVVAV